MVDFFTQNATAFLTLLGVLVGAFATALRDWVMRNRDLNLKLWEKFLERRITAHENVIGLALKMRRMVGFGMVHPDGEVVRVPEVMMSKEAFDGWLIEFADKATPATTWLSTQAKRELNFVQDYFVTIHSNLAGISSDEYPTIGSFAREDFIELSARLERAAFGFFKTEARQRRLNDLEEPHKYPIEVTKARLAATVLLKRWKEIRSAILSDRAPEG